MVNFGNFFSLYSELRSGLLVLIDELTEGVLSHLGLRWWAVVDEERWHVLAGFRGCSWLGRLWLDRQTGSI